MTCVKALVLFCLVSCLMPGCAPQGQPAAARTAKPPLTQALLQTGRRIYEKQCAACHGLTGAGDGPAAYLLYPKPRDFTQNEFRLVSTGTMEATDEDLFLAITRGMPGSSMPSWEQLTPKERWALVTTVRHFSKAPAPDPQDVLPIPAERSKTPEGIARGRELFAQACASCHGVLGKGDGQQVMTDSAGFPVKPRDLTTGIFKGSSESADLYRRIVAGLPGSPMPSTAGVYADEQIWDLVHFVQSLVPAGVEERARVRSKTLRAHRKAVEIPSDPGAEEWQAIEPVEVALTPLWWRDERIGEVRVRALHNGKELAIHLTWEDPTQDSSSVKPQAFPDSAAVQFSPEKNPPFFGMGDAQGAVRIWLWKASWQEDLKGWSDVEAVYPHAAVDWYEAQRTYRHGERAEQDPALMGGWGAGNPLSNPQRTSSAEEAAAKGLGTLTSRPAALQQVQAHGRWDGGRWQVVLRRPFVSGEKEDLRLRPGRKVSVAFAVFDGHAGDRNGQKNVSIWNHLALER